MIKLHFPKLTYLSRALEPVTVSVPFPSGELFELARCRIVDEEGRVFPGQFRATTLWPDGSVKWLLVHLQADLPWNTSVDYYLDVDSSKEPCAVRMSVSGDLIDTGVLRVKLSERPDSMFEYINTPQGRFTREEITPFVIKDKDGNEYMAGTGEAGWEVIEAGPVRAMVRTRGRHRSENGTYFDYKITLYAYAGKPWIDLDYCVTNTESGEPLVLPKASAGLTVSGITSMSLKIKPEAVGEISTCVVHAGNRIDYMDGDVDCLVDEQFLKRSVNEMAAEVYYGTIFGEWHDERRGVAVTIYQAQQNMPKRVAVCKEGLTVDLIPEETGAIEFIEGMAKTHRIQMHFHAADADREKEILFRSIQYQLPDKPVVAPEVYEASGVFGDIFNRKVDHQVEYYIESLFSSRVHPFGMIHWGDNPDSGYTAQGRGGDDCVWINGEYDAGRAFYLYYITRGRRAAYGAMKCATEHLMDVDICHHSSDPGRNGGQIIHSARHASKGCTPSHEWVEGLIDYYHETGDPDVLELAVNVGKNILYNLKHHILNQPHGVNTSAREGGWALFSFTALFLETHDESWLKWCDEVVTCFYEWEKEMGALLTLYAGHGFARIPFMISVAIKALKSYYDVFPTEELKKFILRNTEDMVKYCLSEYTGLFIYKEFPSADCSVVNTQPLGALSHAYELSGDVKFLKYGIPTFEAVIRNLPQKSESNKTFAANALNIFLFYKALMDNGLLPG